MYIYLYVYVYIDFMCFYSYLLIYMHSLAFPFSIIPQLFSLISIFINIIVKNA